MAAASVCLKGKRGKFSRGLFTFVTRTASSVPRSDRGRLIKGSRREKKAKKSIMCIIGNSDLSPLPSPPLPFPFLFSPLLPFPISFSLSLLLGLLSELALRLIGALKQQHLEGDLQVPPTSEDCMCRPGSLASPLAALLVHVWARREGLVVWEV